MEAISLRRPVITWWSVIATWLWRLLVPFRIRLAIVVNRELARREAFSAALNAGIERMLAPVPGEYVYRYAPDPDAAVYVVPEDE